MLHEAQSCNLTATNPSEQLKTEVDKLRQCSRRSCLVISGVELPANKVTKNVEETEEKVCRITETNVDISREDFDNELGNVHRPTLNKMSPEKNQSSTQASKYHVQT